MDGVSEIIRLRGLCVRRGAATILDGVNWSVKPGENWVLMGANGSGKTSLLSVLAGYLTPSGGEVGVCGHTYGAYPWQRLREKLGIVSGSVRRMIKPDFRALEIVASGKGAILNPWEEAAPEDSARAKALLEGSGLAHLAEREWELLSQGERQRVLFLRALMARPALLILDEPCSGLDPVARKHFLDFVEGAANARGRPPMVFVTHHVEEITPSFSHVLLLKSGRVLAAGPKDEVMTGRTLGEAFGEAVRLWRDGDRWRMEPE